MLAKVLEIRDSATFIPVLAVDINPDSAEQEYLINRCGYSCDGLPNVILTRLDGCGQATNDPYDWGGSKTWTIAHDYIILNWVNLKDGDVIDVEFILGETQIMKISERFS